ncbi:lipopolysaccharide-induced tumor necrosis factor-alpha factor homolog [Eupeodes corollae]|uniref:lipopolysaccharide-induced tumor necrosis factor-alpha factor homolog n=1 Tax=Eupeodes corollae TaxID=290404 RepID=UPI0024916DC5|nr:lipopolysaccharide-induced tumor necrosis factor-alpha factor homolog [Eupeodes corollae]
MDYNNPPSYDQATGNSTTQQPPPQRSYPKPPIGFVPADNFSNIPPVQQHPIYPTNYPQQQGQPQPIPTTRVIYVQNQGLPLGPREVYLTCPHCHVQKLTRIDPEPSSKTHLMAALLCILGFWCCACLPYCIESCMNVNHYCGNCNNFLGTYTSDGVVR